MALRCPKSLRISRRVNRRVLSVLSSLLCAAGRDNGTTCASVFATSVEKGLSLMHPTKGRKRLLSSMLSSNSRLRCPPPMPEPLSRYRMLRRELLRREILHREILHGEVSDVFIFPPDVNSHAVFWQRMRYPLSPFNDADAVAIYILR